MQLAILLALIGVLALSFIILIKISLKVSPTDQISALGSSLSVRLDSVQQGLLTGVTTALQNSTQNLATSISDLKVESRSRLDEKMSALAPICVPHSTHFVNRLKIV